MSMHIKLLVFALIAVQGIYGWWDGCDESSPCSKGDGDCDNNNQCKDGCFCEYDNWVGTDYCQANTGDYTEYSWEDWPAYTWDSCSVECGGAGTYMRYVNCIPGSDCAPECPSLSKSDEPDCDNGACQVDGSWGDWTDWETCSADCGTGQQSRSRSCNEPTCNDVTGKCGAACDGDTTETQDCNTQECPINGGWGSFGEWADCSVECGGGTHSRTRVCDTPAPQFDGLECTADGSSDTETEDCNTQECPIDGVWSLFSDWTPCSVDCGGGDQTRTRACDSPAAQYGGAECVGDVTECQACNTDPCAACPAFR